MFDVNWETRSHADIHAQLQGRGAGFTDAGGAWNSLATRLRDVAGSVERATSGIAATRSGPAARAAGGAVGPMGPWADEVRGFSDAVGSASHEQNRALAATRGAVGAPVPRPPVTLQTWEGVGALAALDVDSADRASLDAERRARAAMGRYQEFSSLRASGLPQFSSPGQGAPQVQLVAGGSGAPVGTGAVRPGPVSPGGGGSGAAGTVPAAGAGGGTVSAGPGPGGAIPGAGSGGGTASAGPGPGPGPGPDPGPGPGPGPAGTVPAPGAGGGSVSTGPGVAGTTPTTGGGGGTASAGPGVAGAVPAAGAGVASGGGGSVSTGRGSPGTAPTAGLPGPDSAPPRAGSALPSSAFGPSGTGSSAGSGTGPGIGTGAGSAAGSAGGVNSTGTTSARAALEPTRLGGASVLEPALAPRNTTAGVPLAPVGGIGAAAPPEQRLARASYLVEDDPDALAGELPRVAPPVIGA